MHVLILDIYMSLYAGKLYVYVFMYYVYIYIFDFVFSHDLNTNLQRMR